MTRRKWILYHAVATWPRQLVAAALVGSAFNWLLTGVLNGAPWVSLVSCGALGYALASAVPSPSEARKRLAAPSISSPEGS